MRTATHRTKSTLQIFSALRASAAALAVLAAAAGPAANAMTLRELHALEKSGKQGLANADFYLVGAMEGAVESLTQSERHGSPALLCLEGRRLEPASARSLFQTELKRNADLYEADMPVQLVLFNALTSVYACPE